LLGILSQGLRIASPEAPVLFDLKLHVYLHNNISLLSFSSYFFACMGYVSGHMFGKGIYFADV